MGQPSSRTAGADDEVRLQSLLSQYLPSTEVSNSVPDATIYKRKSPSNPSLPAQVIVGRYPFKGEAETKRFLELVHQRKTKIAKFLPRILDYFLKLDSGYWSS